MKPILSHTFSRTPDNCKISMVLHEDLTTDEVENAVDTYMKRLGIDSYEFAGISIDENSITTIHYTF